MYKVAMSKLLSKLFRRDLYDKIPAEDLMSKQRFVLFRIFSISACIAAIAVSVQEQLTFENPGFLPPFLLLLAVVFIGNYFVVNKIEKLRLSYGILLIACIFLIHVQSYNTGGVRNSGTIYLCVPVLSAFMLLGTKWGKVFTGLVVIHIVYLYFITELRGYFINT